MLKKLRIIVDKIQSKSLDELLFFVSRHIIGRKASSGISLLFFSLCKKLPLRDDVLIFQTEGDFCDNGRALYEYLYGLKDKKRKFVWLVKEPRKFTKRKNTIFISPYSGFRFRYFYYLAIAKNILETHNLTQIEVRPEQNYISLWHGMMIKKGKSSGVVSKGEKPVFNYLLNSSNKTANQQAEFLGCDKKYVISLGFPRNDVLLKNCGEGKVNPLVLSDSEYEKVVVWMPTFRASINPNLSEDSIDTETGLPLLHSVELLNNLSTFCKSRRILIIIKIHHLQAEKEVFNKSFDNIKFVQDEELFKKNVQLYAMLAKTDALITDVSSVFVDYLLLDKPMGFIMTDLQEYEKTRGVLFDNLLDILPGQLVYTIDELKKFLDDLECGKDLFKEKRKEILPFFHDYPDANSCERIKNYFNL